MAHSNMLNYATYCLARVMAKLVHTMGTVSVRHAGSCTCIDADMRLMLMTSRVPQAWDHGGGGGEDGAFVFTGGVSNTHAGSSTALHALASGDSYDSSNGGGLEVQGDLREYSGSGDGGGSTAMSAASMRPSATGGGSSSSGAALGVADLSVARVAVSNTLSPPLPMH